MEMIAISRDRIKIMLSKQDLEEYSLSCSALDYENEQTRAALRSILDKASIKLGFDASPGKVFVQVYESVDGGCEMYVTGLCEEKESSFSVKTFEALSFSSLTALCRRLVDMKYRDFLSIICAGGRWYIRFDEDKCPIYVNDYCDAADDLLGSYINEHYGVMYGINEISKLAML